MEVKGRINQTKNKHYCQFEIWNEINDLNEIQVDIWGKLEDTRDQAKAAAEKFAKKHGFEIEWSKK